MIYVRAALELLRSELAVRGLAHITGGGLLNLLRLNADVGFEIDDPLPVPPVFGLVQRARRRRRRRDVGGLQHGLRLRAPSCPEAQADAAVALLARAPPGHRADRQRSRARRTA